MTWITWNEVLMKPLRLRVLTFEFRVGQDVKSGQPAITRGLDRLDALCRGRRQPVKGLDRLSGDWRAIKRAPIALDQLPPPARLHPSDQGPRQGRAPLRLLHPLKIQKRQKLRLHIVSNVIPVS